MNNPVKKQKWKRQLNYATNKYWKNQCQIEKEEKSTLRYIEIQDKPLNQTHNVWKSVKNNIRDVKAGEIKVRLLTQTYPFQIKRAKFDKKIDPLCQICRQGNEDLEHFILGCNKLELTMYSCQASIKDKTNFRYYRNNDL